MSDPQSLTVPSTKKPISASVSVPGSKSLTNRALLAAALAKGASHLTGCLHSVDTEAMIENLRRLGLSVQRDSDTDVRLTGAGGCFDEYNGVLDCVNAGTATRFLTAAISIVPGIQTVDGNHRMRQRPIQDLIDALKRLGVEIEAPSGCPPVTVSSSELVGGQTSVPGAISSQFLSALLLIAPYAKAPIRIEVEGELVSRPYVDLTLDVVKAVGGCISHREYRSFAVQPSPYEGRDYAVEPDVSSACYWFALAAATGGRVTVQGLRRESRQADIEVLDVLERMGATVETAADSIVVQGPERLVSPGTVDMFHFSDQVMTVAALAALAEGQTAITNVENIRRKETDRIVATATELRRMGIAVEERTDGLTVDGGTPKAAAIETYDDHRMAMSFAILGVRTPGTVILDPGCTRKTYPDFFDRLLEVLA